MRESGLARFFLVTDLRSVGSDFVPYHRTFGVQLRNIAHELESFRKGGRQGSSHTRAIDQDAHLGVEEQGTRIEIERADKDPFLVDGKGLGVETGPERSCEASTFRLVPRRKGGLELVKLDASLQEVRPILYISAVHDDDVGDRKSTRLHSSN